MLEQFAQENATTTQLPSSLSDVLNHLPVGIIMIHPNGQIFFENPYAEGLFHQSIVGQKWADILSSLFSYEQDDGHEVSLTNGKKISIQTQALPNSSGQLITLIDLTLSRAHQEKINEMKRLSVLGDMVAKLAHQLRTPLATALLYVDDLKEESGGQKVHQQLVKLNQLLDDFLIFAKGGKGIIESIDLVELIQNAIGSLVNKKQIQIHVLKSEYLNTQVKVNIVAMEGAIRNIINNAFDASPKNGKLFIEVGDYQNYIKVRFNDQGQGFSELDNQAIFGSFYTTKTNGTGLGLNIVKNVLEAHGGWVKCGNQKETPGAFVEIALPNLEFKE